MLKEDHLLFEVGLGGKKLQHHNGVLFEYHFYLIPVVAAQLHFEFSHRKYLHFPPLDVGNELCLPHPLCLDQQHVLTSQETFPVTWIHRLHLGEHGYGNQSSLSNAPPRQSHGDWKGNLLKG